MAQDNQGILWEVFIQSKPGQPHRHCGSVHGHDRELALQNARDVYTRRNEGTNLWVVPSNYIVSSSPEDIGPFFEPANDKIYRHPTFYTIPEGITHM